MDDLKIRRNSGLSGWAQSCHMSPCSTELSLDGVREMQWKRKQERDVGKREVREISRMRRIPHSVSGSVEPMCED